MTDRLYPYVGPDPVRRKAAGQPPGRLILSAGDLEAWIRDTGQEPDASGRIAATFIVGPDGLLRVADRHSEHVACAGGGPVLSAGEMFFQKSGSRWSVEEVSNQSTGYVPDPDSWPAVAAALDRIPLPHPGRFTLPCVFRRCTCGQINLVKDGDFTCGSCGDPLPPNRNLP